VIETNEHMQLHIKLQEAKMETSEKKKQSKNRLRIVVLTVSFGFSNCFRDKTKIKCCIIWFLTKRTILKNKFCHN
jgi:hypothetical protein